MHPPADLDKFLALIGPRSPGGCQEWQGTRTNQGYGVWREGPHPIGAHRVAYAAAHGITPGAMWVLHHCDNPPCVAMEHLYLGGNPENVRDRVERGRGLVGARHPQARLGPESVIRLRTEHHAGRMTVDDVIAETGLSRSAAYSMLAGRSWRSAPGPLTDDGVRARGQVRGETAPLARLTADQVLDVRSRYRNGTESLSEIARSLGVSKSTLRQAVTGQTWPHLPGAVPVGTRGRTGPKGEKSGSASLTAEQVVAIRQRAAAGETQAALAAEYGVRAGAVSKIVRRERWAHV